MWNFNEYDCILGLPAPAQVLPAPLLPNEMRLVEGGLAVWPFHGTVTAAADSRAAVDRSTTLAYTVGMAEPAVGVSAEDN